MEFDPHKFVAALTVEIRRQRPFIAGLKSMLQWCAKHLPHGDWKKVAALDFEADEKKAQTWIPKTLKAAPSPFPIHGMYFGLHEYSTAKDEEYAKLYVGFLGQYDPKDKKASWVFGAKRHYPEKSTLNARALKAAGVIFNRESGEGLGNDGNFMFCMTYANLLVASLMTPELHLSLKSKADRIGLLAGWDSGDYMNLGELTAKGFVPKRGAMI